MLSGAFLSSAVGSFQIEMPSRDDRTPKFCSERMKICQKHLSNVYSRSKSLLSTARAGKVVPEVTGSAARGFADGKNNLKDSNGLSKHEKKHLSPYLCAVSGLFDGPSLLKQFHLKKICGGLAEKNLKGSSQADCPQSCNESASRDPGSAPLFFKENSPGSAPTTITSKSSSDTAKYSSKTAALGGHKGGEHEGDGFVEPPVSLNSPGKESNFGVQASGASPLSTLPEQRARVGQLGNSNSSPSLVNKYSIDDMGKWNLPNISSDKKAFPKVVIPQSSFPSYKHSSTGPSSVTQQQQQQQQQRAITTTTSSRNPFQRLLPSEAQQKRPSSGSGRKPAQLASGTESPRKSGCRNSRNPQLARNTDSQQRGVPSKNGRNPPLLLHGADSQQRADPTSSGSKGPSKKPGGEHRQRAMPTTTNRGDSVPQQKGRSTPADSQPATFSSRLKKEKKSGSVLQASVAKVFGASVGPPKSLKNTLTASQLHDAICDHMTPDCPSFRKRDKFAEIPEVTSSALSEPRHPHEDHDHDRSPGDDAQADDFTPSRQEIVSANDKCAQYAFEVRTDMRRQEKSSANLWKYGNMAVCTENPGRDYTTGESPPDALEMITKKKLEISGFHWSKSGSRRVVNHVCHILTHNQWGSGVVELLDAVKGLVNCHCVNAILQQQKDPHMCLAFFKWAQRQKGYKHDVFAFTTMINILGRARNLRGVRHLLEDMHTDGVEPNVVTYNTLILCYGKVESLNESMRVFRIMQEAGCKPDNVTYSILIHLCIKAEYMQEALKLYQSLLEAGVQPDTITYSIVIDSLGKSGNLKESRKLFREMKERGCVPNEFTFNSLMNRHAKARKTHHALKYYTEMRAAGFKLDKVTCTTMMGVLGSVGKFEQAEGLFSEMQQAGIVADTAAYSLMINMWGTSGNLDKAVSWYGRMLGNLVTPSLSVFTSLVNAHLEANLYQAAQHFLTSMVMWGINPDLKLYNLLLGHCILCEKQEHADAVLSIMDRLEHPAHRFLYELLTAVNQDRQSIRARVVTYFESADQEEQENKQGFANALIEFLHKLQCKTDPGVVWETCMDKGIFPASIVRWEAPNHWLVDLHSLAVGTALVALPRLLVMLRDKWVQSPTKRVYVITGWGKRSRVAGTSALKQAVHDVLEATRSPFSLDHANAGVFVSNGPPFCDWMSEPLIMKTLGAIASEGVVK